MLLSCCRSQFWFADPALLVGEAAFASSLTHQSQQPVFHEFPQVAVGGVLAHTDQPRRRATVQEERARGGLSVQSVAESKESHLRGFRVSCSFGWKRRRLRLHINAVQLA